jgi:outer membrane immunogenic protein
VIGVQGSFSGAHIDGTGFEQDVFPTAPQPDTVFESFYSKTDWIASVTGRLGFAPWSPQTLIYAKGGVAFAHDRHIFTEVETLPPIGGTPDNGIQTATDTRIGWTAGLGFEWAFAPNWSVWVEANHYGFGAKTLAFSPNEFLHPEFESIRQRIEVVTFGVNYRFNFGKAPLVASY